MKHLKKVVLSMAVVTSSAVAFSLSLSLNQAQSMALGQGYTSVINQNNSDILSLQRENALKAILPSLSWNTSYQPVGEQATRGANTISNTLTLSQPIFNAGIFLGTKAAFQVKDIASDNLSQSQKTLMLSIEKQYLQVLQDQNQVSVLQQQIATNQENLKQSQAMLAMNLIVKSDLLTIQYQLASAQTSLLTAQNTLQSDLLTLKNMLNIPSSESLTLTTVDTTTPDITKRNVQEDMTNAYNTSNIRYLQDNLTYQKAQTLGTGLNDMLPTLSLTGSYSAGGTTLPNSVNGAWGWSYGLALSMPLFDWGTHVATYQIAKKNATILEAQTQQSIDSYMTSIQTQYNLVVQYQQLGEALQVQYESAQQTYAAQKVRYESGLIDSTDFMTAENNLYSSEIAYDNNALLLRYNYDLYMSMIQG